MLLGDVLVGDEEQHHFTFLILDWDDVQEAPEVRTCVQTGNRKFQQKNLSGQDELFFVIDAACDVTCDASGVLCDASDVICETTYDAACDVTCDASDVTCDASDVTCDARDVTCDDHASDVTCEATYDAACDIICHDATCDIICDKHGSQHAT